jgi:hypothetical protein
MKKFALILSVAALMAFSAAATHAGLVSLYTFDDIANLGANAVSSSLNGTLGGSTLPTADTGKLGGGMYTVSAGTGSIASVSYLSLPTSTPPCGQVNGSVSLWLKANMSADDNNLLAIYGSTWLDTYYGKFLIYASKPGGVIYVSSPNNNWANDTNNFHMVTMAWGNDGSGAKANVYVDGVSIGVMSSVSGTPSWSTSTTYAASYSGVMINGSTQSGDVDPGLTGTYDDYGIWSNILTAAQAKAIYEVGNQLGYNAKSADALFNLYVNGGSAVVGGQTWTKYGSGTAFDGTGALSGGASLALGASGGVQIIPEPGTFALLIGAALGLLIFAWQRRN